MTAHEENPDDFAETQGNDYFVSLTDLMTGVVFIFVILLISYALVFRAEQAKATQLAEEAQTARTLADARLKAASEAEARAKKLQDDLVAKAALLEGEKESNRRKAQQIDTLAKLLRDREQARRAMLEEIADRLGRRGVEVRLDADNGIIRLPESLLFDSGKADLRDEGREALQIVGRELITTIGKWCPQGGDFRLESLFIEGHTDNRPISNEEFRSNWELSTARAVNTSLAVTSAAPALETLRNPSGAPILGVSGYGENRPVYTFANNSEDGRRLNRRIDIRFIVAYPTAEQFRKVQDILAEPVNEGR